MAITENGPSRSVVRPARVQIVTALRLRDRPAAVPVIAQVLFYPLADPDGDYPSSERFAQSYMLTRDSLAYSSNAYRGHPEDRRYAPTNDDLAGMPPAVIVAAGLDPIRDQARAYASALATAGVEVVFQEAAGNIHGFATLRRAIASSTGDVSRALAAAKALVGRKP